MSMLSLLNRHPENKWILLIVCILFVYSLFASKIILKTIAQSYHYIRQERFFNFELTAFLPVLPIAVYCIYLACSLPLSYDESFTLKYFTNRGFFHSLTNYPAPNNHVLHTLLTTLTYPLLPIKNAIALRLPAILFTLLSLLLAGKTLRNQPGSFFIYCLLLIFSFGYIEYSFQARGYSLQVFFATASYVLYNRSGYFMERWGLFLLMTILGLYTSPAYLYIALPVGLMFLLNNLEEIRSSFKTWILLTLYGIGLLILLYAPIMLKSGYAVIVSNPTVSPLETVSVMDVCKHVVVIFNWFGLSRWGICMLVLFTGWVLWSKNYLLLLLIAVPILMMLVLKQLPFPRIFIPLYFITTLYSCQNLPRVFFQKFLTHTYLTASLLTLASVVSLISYQQNTNRGDINTAFEMKRLEERCDLQTLLVSTNVNWYFKTTYEGYCLLHRFPKKYIDEPINRPDSTLPGCLLTTTQPNPTPTESFLFIVPHYLLTPKNNN
jgi:hypothetical protein